MMAIRPIGKRRYSVFSNRLHARAVKNRIPLNCSFEVTYRCNFRCPFCYIPGNSHKEELSYQGICHILDEIQGAGCLWLLLTGGEPLARDDFLDIYGYAKRRGFLITLFTNGSLLTPKIADFLKQSPPMSIEITIYGMTPETYRKVTGIRDSFQKTLRGIRMLLDRKLPLILKTVVTTLNKYELAEIKNYAKKLGVSWRFDGELTPSYTQSKNGLAFRLSPEELARFDWNDSARRIEWRAAFKELDEDRKNAKLFDCVAGVCDFNIDPYGNSSVCGSLPSFSYNLLAEPFSLVWDRYFPQTLRLRRHRADKCARCRIAYACGNCPALSFLEGGNLRAAIPFACELTEERVSLFAENSYKKGGNTR